MPLSPFIYMQLFVGLTSFLICIFFIFISLKKETDRVLVLIQLVLLVLYWIFWLSAAAATAATVQSVNSSWNFANNYDCNYAGVYLNWSGANGWCQASKRKGAVRACCAFSWLTWALWTASLALFVIEDIIRDKSLSSKPKAANGTPAAGSPEPPVAKISPVPASPAAVETV